MMQISAAERVPMRDESFLAMVITQRITRDVIFELVLERKGRISGGGGGKEGLLGRRRI